MGILFDIDPLSGAVETFDYDPMTKTSIITRTENVDAILDANTASYNEGMHKSAGWRGQNDDFWHVGSIPLTTLHSWLDEFNTRRPMADWVWSPYHHDEEWERFMYTRWNSNEFRKLKTAPVNF